MTWATSLVYSFSNYSFIKVFGQIFKQNAVWNIYVMQNLYRFYFHYNYSSHLNNYCIIPTFIRSLLMTINIMEKTLTFFDYLINAVALLFKNFLFNVSNNLFAHFVISHSLNINPYHAKFPKCNNPSLELSIIIFRDI